MPHYLLAVHAGAMPADTGDANPPSADDMAAMMQPILDLEDALADQGAWVFGGRLTDPGSATVVRTTDGDTMLTDGPYVESKEHIAGFYVIEADDLDAALAWTEQVSAATRMPIELRPFAATGRARDHLPTA